MAVQFIDIGGQKVAVMPLADYDRLVADAEDRAEEEAARDAETRRNGGEEYLPADMVDRLLAGESPLRIWRKFRGMSLQQLAKKSGVSSAYLSQIEHGVRDGTLKAWRAFAAALDLDLDDILPPDPE